MNHTTIIYDTLHNYERLIKVGFNESQAKEQTAIISELVDNKLSTKNDLIIGLKELENRLIKWFIGTNITLLGIPYLFDHIYIYLNN